MTILAGGTPWCIDTPPGRSTPRTIHRTTCTGPADGKVVPLHGMANFDETELRAYVAGKGSLRLCPTCLPVPGGGGPPKAREPGTGELGSWKPEFIRAVDALRDFGWTGFDPANLDDLAEVADTVLSAAQPPVEFADVLPPSKD